MWNSSSGGITGGWTIQRKGDLFNPNGLRLNGTKFHRQLDGEINDYAAILRAEPWDSQRWHKFRKKMSAICTQRVTKPFHLLFVPFKRRLGLNQGH
jgi:hypothetical protein